MVPKFWLLLLEIDDLSREIAVGKFITTLFGGIYSQMCIELPQIRSH